MIDESTLPATALIIEWNPHDLTAIVCIAAAMLLLLALTLIPLKHYS